MKRIAIFASGSGTNAQRIIEYFKSNEHVEISLVLSNKSDAFVLKRAINLNVNTFLFNKEQLLNTDIIINKLIEKKIDLVVLAGFLLLLPENILKAFPNRIINIHPALLPKYGGKGMYGMHVHEAVINAGEKESGISIHYVNEKYDEGQIIFQTKCKLEHNESPQSLAIKVHQLEYRYYPQIIEKIIAEINLKKE
ncbi:phosphoribosylglycinamide formyltransferase [candidate division KSB1 bacterium]